MSVVTRKQDFCLVFKVKNANPNGDPLGGNRPRTTSEGLGEVSDVCLKRKLRNRLQEMGENIFVQSDENVNDGMKSLSERFNSFKKELSKEEEKNTSILAGRVCEKWFDVRAFGQVFAFKAQKGVDEVSLGIRGPITIQSAFSVEPVTIESLQITKSVNSENTENGKKSSDTMGTKHRINHGVYVTYGSISPQLASKTGLRDEDVELFKKAVVTIFDNDESSARPSGSMEVVQVIWWNHNSKNGQYPSSKVHESVHVDAEGNITIDSLEDLKPELLVK